MGLHQAGWYQNHCLDRYAANHLNDFSKLNLYESIPEQSLKSNCEHSKRLEAQGIRTAYDFANLPDSWIKKHMSVLELRLKKDLLGLPYIKLEDVVPAKKSIATTRSFKSNLSQFHQLEERISTYANSCAEKLRKQEGSCSAVLIFIRSNSHQKKKNNTATAV